MPARVPLDVDLEDKVFYGLTPTRLAYMVVAMLAGFASWSSGWSPVPLRAAAAAACIGIGAAVSWGSWRGRPADVWIVDIVLFTLRTRRLSCDRSLLRKRWRLGEVPKEIGAHGASVEASWSPR